MIYTLSLADPRAILETVGGKGASLARLSTTGLPVPGGFHITTEAYRQFVAANNLQPVILAELEKGDGSSLAALETVSQAISRHFQQGQMPNAIAQSITQAYNSLSGADPMVVAVRSSATTEDLPNLSFAGLQETYLNIQGIEAVLAAVKRCWSSLWTARAIGYRQQHHFDQETVSLAVVVQQLVMAEASGILFTANPVTGQQDQVMISATWGLGEAIVGGLVTPDTLVVDKSTGQVLTRQTAVKQVMTVCGESGTKEQPIPEAKQRLPVLDDQAARQLLRLALQIEQLYNLPMDVEWALAQGLFVILQARPITILPESPVQPPIEWKLPEPNGEYMRGSIIEQLPEPLTPLFATLGGSIIEDATRALFADFIGVKEFKVRLFVTINDYGYLNLNFGKWAMIRGSVAMLFRLKEVFQQAEARWQRAHHHYLAVIQHWELKPPGEYSASELLTGIRELTGEAMRMYTVLQTGPIPSASGSEIMFTQTYNRLIKKRGDPEAAVFLMGYESMPIRAELGLYDLAMWARSQASLTSHLIATPASQLKKDLNSSNTPTGVDPENWGEWRRRFYTHLACYGHSTYDLDFSKAVPADDPILLLETCRMYLLDKVGNPHTRVQEFAGRREQASNDMLKRLHGLKRWLFHKQMHSAQKYAPLREDGLSDLGLGYPLLRQMLREFGRRLVQAGAILQPEDVFWLYEQEVELAADALDQNQSMSSLMEAIRTRQAVWKAEQRVSAPMVLPVGSKFMGIDLGKFTSGGPSTEKNVIKGFGVSQGKVTAPARVLLGPEDFDQMCLGDVLVAPITTPAWTPLFTLASAIVTDIGGPLSHSSIIAREYGIPAVLGTASATRRIQNGQMITVDGTAGTVILS